MRNVCLLQLALWLIKSVPRISLTDRFNLPFNYCHQVKAKPFISPFVLFFTHFIIKAVEFVILGLRLSSF